jgi:hypothetical protein
VASVTEIDELVDLLIDGVEGGGNAVRSGRIQIRQMA